MTLTLDTGTGQYRLHSSYEERAFPKAAGFRWDPVRKQWWTEDRNAAAKLADAADDTCRVDLLALRDHHAASLEASRQSTVSADDLASVPVPAGLTPYPFQVAGIRYALSRPATLIADEMGLGKTVEALAVINSDPTVTRTLVVCPAHLRLNWQREAGRWLTRPTQVFLASAKAWPTLPARGDVIVVAHYEALTRHAAVARSIDWDLLIADEAHYLKSPRAQRSIAVLGTVAQKRGEVVAPIAARRKLFLTGSPVLNRPRELFNLIRGLDPVTWANEGRFLFRYCGPETNRWGTTFNGCTNGEELQRKLRETIMVRRLKADVLTELPAKVRQVLVLPCDGTVKAVVAERKAIERVLRDRGLEPAGDDYVDTIRSLEGNAVAFAEISRIRHETALAKVPAVADHVRDALDSREKVVVFVHHRDVAVALATALAEFGAVLATGEQSIEQRQAAVDAFQTDPEVRVIVASIYGAGTGFTLTAASLVIFAELAWTPGDLSQAEDRLHRIGQTDSVLIQHLVLEGSLDERMAQTIIAKQDMILRVTDALTVDPIALAHAATVRACLGRFLRELASAAYASEYPTGADEDAITAQIPCGYYALDGTDSAKNETVFFRVDRPTEGKWVGRVFVQSLVGGHEPQRLAREAAPSILRRIAAVGWREAVARYGRELNHCGLCSKELTDDESRQRGVGPTCWKKLNG